MQVDAYIGEIRLMGFNFAPEDWAKCEGQLLQIAQHTALFSLLGTKFGGDGRTTFAVPDLRGRAAISDGQGPGLYNYVWGQRGGQEMVKLTGNEMPAHSHTINANNQQANQESPQNNFLAQVTFPQAMGYNDGLNNKVQLNELSINNTGGNQPHENRSPYLALNYCIALTGIYPNRS